MLVKSLTTAIIACWAFGAVAQESSDNDPSQDPTDLSRYDILDDESQFTTLPDLLALEGEARAAVEGGDCEAATEVLVRWADSSNLTANLLRQTLEPFYGASMDDRDEVTRDRSLMSELAPVENMSNNLIRDRNEAWLMEAECLLQMGERDEAIVRLFRALDYISPVREGDLWERARTLLWNEVGYQP